MKKAPLGLCFVVAAFALSGDDRVTAQTPPHQQPGQAHATMKNLTDSEFVPMMIRHHQDGIEMSRLEEARGSSSDVKALAAKIRQSQERDIAQLREHAQGTAQTPKGTSGRAAHETMMDQQSQAMMKKLRTASGQTLDRAFLEEMAKHHEGAISMTESANLRTPELKQMAQKMVEAQRKELAEIRKLLASQTRS